MVQLSRRRRRMLYTGGAALFGSGSAYWFFGRAEVAETNRVAIRAAQFRPRNIEVPVGTTVTWNHDGASNFHALHSLTDGWNFAAEHWDDESKSSVPLNEGQSVEYTFEEAGLYEVGCHVHPDMRMKIGVDTEIEDPLGGWF